MPNTQSMDRATGPAPVKSGATRTQVAVELADLASRSEHATVVASRRLLHAVLVTLSGPATLLVLGQVLWPGGWPTLAVRGLVVALTAAIATWLRWVPAQQEARRRRARLLERRTASASRRGSVIRTGSLWSARA